MNKLALDEILKNALKEDIGFGDLTSKAIFNENHFSRAYLLAKQNFILAGIDVFTRVFALLDERVKIKKQASDGTKIDEGEQFVTLEGPTRSLLTGERVALNFLQHLSGIATKTNDYVEAVGDFSTIIVDTRKTTPGLRMLEKHAVTIGGGKNHRYGLDSMVLIKDNHIQAAGGIIPAVRRVRNYISPFIKIEVEVAGLEQINEALEAKVDLIMLDNLSLAKVKEAVQIVGGRALLEVSGNVTIEKVADLAATGVDIISSGALTHSVKAVDISMKIE
ncbi:MAG: carboxylating nicotinate-nucleotide diphosphorylase [Peptococcia bacterium]|jgi:nicotinate-nucleotide pyrophosphorylase (carboxylating)